MWERGGRGEDGCQGLASAPALLLDLDADEAPFNRGGKDDNYGVKFLLKS